MTHLSLVKSLTALTLFTFFSFSANAQDSLSQWELTDKLEFSVNGTIITGSTDYKILEAAIGKADSKKESANGEVSYKYEKLGLLISVKEDKVKVVGFNFNWDGDDKFPEKTFDGTLKISNYTFSTETTDKEVAAIAGVTFMCPIPSICATADRKASVKSMIAFEDSLVTQVLVMLE